MKTTPKQLRKSSFTDLASFVQIRKNLFCQKSNTE